MAYGLDFVMIELKKIQDILLMGICMNQDMINFFLETMVKNVLGLAFDYMKGSTSYDDIAGKGNNSRKGIWLYDTWIGDDGHYSDYILKWGHLENDFEIAGTKKLNLIKGNYDNDVFLLVQNMAI